MGDGNDVTIYTKEDFLDSTAPFEELYKLIDDPFELNRKLEKMAQLAKATGVNGFKGMFKDYCQKVRMTNNQVFAYNVSNFDKQEIELETGQWQADDGGIRREGPYGSEVIACVHPIMPVKRLVNIDTGIEKLELAYRKGYQWRKMIFDRRQIASASSIVALSDYGVAVTSENAKYLVQYLHDVENLNYEKIPESSSVSRLGWIGEEGFAPYVENLVFDGDIAFKHFFESVGARGSFDQWLRAVKQIRAEGNVPAKILVAASFASVLVGPCNCLPFFVHLWGGTESGKTVGLMLAASVFANPEMGKYIHTFNSTAVAQELSASFVNSLPLILDELQIVKDRKDFDQLIYQLSEGVGRSRGQKTGGLQRTGIWNNCIITTGEQPISSSHSGGGAINRIIEISCEDTKLFKDPAGLVDVIRKNHGHAGKLFVDKLMEPGMMDLARTTQKSLYKELTETEITEKQALAASLILTADALIDNWIFKDGHGLAIKEVAQFLSTHDEVSVNLKAYEWLMEWLAQNSAHFDENQDRIPDTWGKIAYGSASIVRSVFNKACTENGYNPTAFLSWLKRNDKLELTKSGKGYTKAVKINKVACHCVVIKRIEGQVEGFEEMDKTEQMGCTFEDEEKR
ncbi:DUF927 domain-containing protein [Clostridiales Family XIII bacterium ASD5510]|uniref:DUF927 domain-containing protein n=1 Tax=Hominibacterium faecale TaxID=2839743 RepID=A0A9J6QZX0_9FIRM|nr:DUF927 domain-containing protein [Hominibacterium faecale]MCU7381032.1 DUF927 domain-containing protein [Hominibacterium faecale]